MPKALFLDRDGIFCEVVIRDLGPRKNVLTSPRNWDEVRHLPGLDGLKDIKALGYRLVMITNQPDIERGLVSKEFMEELHDYYRTRYALDGIYVCLAASNSDPDKKPNPGLFFRAADDFSTILSECFHLGDTDKDVEAAARAGCKSILWERPYNQDCKPDYRVSSLKEVRDILVGK